MPIVMARCQAASLGLASGLTMAEPTGSRPLKDGSIRRRTAVRAPKRTFLVFREGTRIQPDYIKAPKQESAVRDSA